MQKDPEIGFSRKINPFLKFVSLLNLSNWTIPNLWFQLSFNNRINGTLTEKFELVFKINLTITTNSKEHSGPAGAWKSLFVRVVGFVVKK